MATKTTNLGLSKAELTDAVRSTLIANNENFDKIDEAYTQLKQENEEESQAIAENAEQIDTLQGQIDRLRANQVQGSISGTEVVVQDAAEMESVLQLSGNSEQDTRSGKNKLQNTIESTTKHGLTLTKNQDGSIVINGTATGEGSFNIYNGANKDLKEGKYVFSGIESGGTSTSGQPNSRYIQIYIDDSSIGVAGASSSYKTFTLDSVPTKLRVALFYKVGAVFENFVVYPQIEEGSTPTSYEPYGIQPSPDYPSEIRSVTELGQNLLKLKSGTETADGVTFTYNEDGSVTLSGTAEQGNHMYLLADLTNAPIVFKGGSYYTQSITVVSGSFDGISFTTFAKGKTNLQVMNNNQTRTFGEDCTVIRAGITFVEGTVLDCTFFVQIERGDKATTWKPYGYVPVELKVEGKNKVRLKDITGTSGGATTILKDQIFTLNGTTTGGNFYPETTFTVPEDGKYTFSIDKISVDDIGSCSAILRVGDYPTGNEWTTVCELSTKTSNTIPWTGVLNSSKYYSIRIWYGSRTFTDYKFSIQLEKGTKATEWTAHIEPKTIPLPLGDIQLRSTPDGTRDTFERVDGVWNKKENVKELHYTKDFWWSLRAEPFQDVVCFQTDMNNGKFTVDGKKLMSNLFKSYPSDNFLNNEQNYEGISTAATTNGYLRLKIAKNRLNSLDSAGLQTWLENNSLYVYYELVTPTYTPITDTTLISALDELEQLILHKGYNYITATSVNGVKAQLDLSYYKDINTVLNNLTAMIATIGGELNV